MGKSWHQTCNHTLIRVNSNSNDSICPLRQIVSQHVSCYVTVLSKSISYHAMLRDIDYWFTITTHCDCYSAPMPKF